MDLLDYVERALMMSRHETTITDTLLDWAHGDADALGRLMPHVAGELRGIADRALGRERPSHTLQPTALVHELFLRLVALRKVNWKNRAHFLGYAAHTMRRILVDYARRHRAEKRGGEAVRVELSPELAADGPRELEILAVDQALSRLAELDPRQARIVELRFFGGLTAEEIAELTGLSLTTVHRTWATARLWLFRELSAAF